MSLTANPPTCTVPAAGGTSTHKLVNGGADKFIFKIKSSNNNEYRTTPVFGFIDPTGYHHSHCWSTKGGQAHFANAPADATDAQAAFAAVTPAGTVTIPMFATA
ncbi:Protein CBG03996 [Caenorhabditis briggsae]|uniref:MSP domain-containing protein n=2 Tax=Caenorhabditis briggsae TaxID=6238 RepID=A0AAE9DTT0_CAEBR|nr:Protein CBG03996 [Caenorhabditis briggsae]ULU10553.1 hypothetical protein L3Y34_014675 [Caenorhabditis briggsae]UMM11491.1 hypothetical protein L5515_000750 [Caenorhabditis briggsae]CAP24794.1 Protein CBG03996 [Caenorhabditis briggsae]